MHQNAIVAFGGGMVFVNSAHQFWQCLPWLHAREDLFLLTFEPKYDVMPSSPQKDKHEQLVVWGSSWSFLVVMAI